MTHITSSWRQMRVTVFVATLSLVMLTSPDISQVQMTDITSSGLGTEVSTPITLPNGTINHDITGGSRPGNGPNLFHSFGEFSVATNSIANFLNDTAMPTTNILSRVTGGNPSNIFGTLQTTNFGAANLYLINPAGIIFGPTSSLNVGGSFTAGTADYLKMADGATFYANAAQSTVLSIAPVAAFGFLSPAVSPISIQGGPGMSPLSVLPGQSLSLIGGNITVTGRTLSTSGGAIAIASVASSGEVAMVTEGGQPPEPTMGVFTTLGNISLLQGTKIESNAPALGGQPGGLAISGGTVAISEGTQITTRTEGSAPGGGIAFTVNELTVEGGTKITSETSGLGRGGDITITGSSVTVGGTVAAETSGPGAGGAIRANVGTLHLTEGAEVSSGSTSVQPNAGEPGQIALQAAGTFQSHGGTVATSATQARASEITIDAGDVVLANGTGVSSESEGAGNAGGIRIVSATNLLMRNSAVTTFAVQASGGNIKLGAPNIIRLVDSRLTASGLGQAGDSGSNIGIDPQLVVIQNSQILADANAGAGGNITIAAGALLVDSNSVLAVSADSITAPIQILSGVLVPLKLAYIQSALSGNRCAADPKGQFNSFVQTGRDGVPQVPGALSPSPLSFLETLTSGSWGSPWPNVAAARLGLDSVSVDDSTLFRFHSACRS